MDYIHKIALKSILFCMELTYNQLKKRDVINVVDGKCLGRIIDMTFRFPQGIITGITVEGRRTFCLFRAFNKSNLFIPDRNIVKIGGDVILVNLRCGEVCSDNQGVRPPSKPDCKPKHDCSPPINFSAQTFSEEESSEQINFDQY